MKESLPEEKLLKLIRGKKSDKERPPAKSIARAPKSFETKYLFSFLNGLLVIGAVALAGSLVYRIFFDMEKNKGLGGEGQVLTEVKGSEPKAAVSPKPPEEYYKNQFAKRDLFERPLDQVAANASVDLTKRYKLVGIVLGPVPEAIIEDLTTNGTVFVHEGEVLDAVQVKKIEEGRVVFLQEGLEVELKQ
jgi:hypothetical protein